MLDGVLPESSYAKFLAQNDSGATNQGAANAKNTCVAMVYGQRDEHFVLRCQAGYVKVSKPA